MNEYKITLQTLLSIKNKIPIHSEDDHSTMAEDHRDTIRSIEKVMRLVESEYQVDQDAHSEISLEVEIGKAIPLGEWARRNGLDDAYARKKAKRGSLKTAHKIGRNWFISELEPNVDNRRR